MFSTPFAQPSKRPREDINDDVDLDLWGSESRHEHKKLRALPFRTSPTIPHTSSFSQTHAFAPRTQNRTPVDSSDDESDDDELPDIVCMGPPPIPSRVDPFVNISTGEDDDMAMTDSEVHLSSPLPWQTPKVPSIANESSFLTKARSFGAHPRTRSPPRPMLAPSNIVCPTNSYEATGRIPTPIYGHFSRNPVGSLMPGIHQPASFRNSGPISPIPASPISPAYTSTEDSAWWQRRGMPSPAPASQKKDDDIPMSPVGMIDTMLPRLNVSPPSVASSIPSPNSVTAGNDNFENPPPSPYGRARSNATTSLPGDTSSTSRLSMGFKADCEKCVRRVPGHYTHIVRG